MRLPEPSPGQVRRLWLLRDETEVEHHRRSELCVVGRADSKRFLEVGAGVGEVVVLRAQEGHIAASGERRRECLRASERSAERGDGTLELAFGRPLVVGMVVDPYLTFCVQLSMHCATAAVSAEVPGQLAVQAKRAGFSFCALAARSTHAFSSAERSLPALAGSFAKMAVSALHMLSGLAPPHAGAPTPIARATRIVVRKRFIESETRMTHSPLPTRGLGNQQ